MSGRDGHLELLHAAYGERARAVERLGGGVQGRCYRVQGESFDHAVRLPAPDHGEFCLAPSDEQRTLASVAAVGLAPPVVALDASFGLVATEYLADARPWAAADAQKVDNIDSLAALLKSLHACELELPPYACVAAAERYTRSARERSSLSVEQRMWREELLQRSREFEARFPAETPCHNDLVASNVLDDGKLWLIDFEYAVMSAPILDLAGFAGLNDLDADQHARLISAYYGHDQVPFDAQEFHAAIRVVRLLSYFWALAVAAPGGSERGLAAFADAMAAMLR